MCIGCSLACSFECLLLFSPQRTMRQPECRHSHMVSPSPPSFMPGGHHSHISCCGKSEKAQITINSVLYHLVFYIILYQQFRKLTLPAYIIIIIIIKTSSTGPDGKTELFINCLCNPTSTCATENKKQTQWSNQQLTAPLNPSNVPVSNTV